MEYPLILIDNVDTLRTSKRTNIGIELRNAILKKFLEAENEGGTYHMVLLQTYRRPSKSIGKQLRQYGEAYKWGYHW